MVVASMNRENEWENLKAEISSCSKCPLHKSRTKPVPGEGNLYSTVLFLGEAPGKTEDEEGRPFVGAAGKLLTKLIEEIGLRRENVFITNVVKCRPPNNREPKYEEIKACSYFTDRIISLVSPQLIVTLGNYAGYYVFELKGGAKWLGISRMRGKLYRLTVVGSPRAVIATYHPAAALYNPQLYNALREDFELSRKLLASEKAGDRGLMRYVK